MIKTILFAFGIALAFVYALLLGVFGPPPALAMVLASLPVLAISGVIWLNDMAKDMNYPDLSREEDEDSILTLFETISELCLAAFVLLVAEGVAYGLHLLIPALRGWAWMPLPFLPYIVALVMSDICLNGNICSLHWVIPTARKLRLLT